MENKVIVLCGAPGSGKTTVRKYLTENFAIEPVLTHTTRPKRKGEHDGIDYWFETRETFFENHYLEYVEYDGNLYGSSYESLERAWQKAPVATIVLDTKGAETYLERIPEKTEVVYLCVTDEKVQRERMEQRGDDADKIRRRLASQEAKRDRKQNATGNFPKGLLSMCMSSKTMTGKKPRSKSRLCCKCWELKQLADFCGFGQDFEVLRCGNFEQVDLLVRPDEL